MSSCTFFCISWAFSAESRRGWVSEHAQYAAGKLSHADSHFIYMLPLGQRKLTLAYVAVTMATCKQKKSKFILLRTCGILQCVIIVIEDIVLKMAGRNAGCLHTQFYYKGKYLINGWNCSIMGAFIIFCKKWTEPFSKSRQWSKMLEKCARVAHGTFQ